MATTDPVHPAGWQLDFYGAAIARLDLKNQEDLDSCDYVFGLPLTYGNERWQFKFGYAHLSSHLGDEFMRSAIPGCRSGELRLATRWCLARRTTRFRRGGCTAKSAGAVHPDGGAAAWETQFGTELSRPGPTGNHVTPFVAINGRVRETTRNCAAT